MSDDAADRANQFGAEFIDLENCSFPPELLARIPAAIARSYQVVPLAFSAYPQRASLKIAISDPSDLDALDDIHQLLRCDLEVAVANPNQLRTFISKLYPLGT
ncbi:MAG: type fimbrial assembly protein PilB [Verrucomicrobia bacterium]|jgi:hypothetical protein|nr:type fimbrial assembly protein PilB [Verrucomicrobiota bacterium]